VVIIFCHDFEYTTKHSFGQFDPVRVLCFLLFIRKNTFNKNAKNQAINLYKNSNGVDKNFEMVYGKCRLFLLFLQQTEENTMNDYYILPIILAVITAWTTFGRAWTYYSFSQNINTKWGFFFHPLQWFQEDHATIADYTTIAVGPAIWIVLWFCFFIKWTFYFVFCGGFFELLKKMSGTKNSEVKK
jgi:hypothetical protein